MLFTTTGLGEFLSGVIMHEETIRQRSSPAKPLVEVLAEQGITTGIKVDAGACPLAGAPAELVTEGLDGLRERLKRFRTLGARFAKWRAVFNVGSALPTRACIGANGHAAARFAALCQEQGLVPLVEVDVLPDGIPHPRAVRRGNRRGAARRVRRASRSRHRSARPAAHAEHGHLWTNLPGRGVTA